MLEASVLKITTTVDGRKASRTEEDALMAGKEETQESGRPLVPCILAGGLWGSVSSSTDVQLQGMSPSLVGAPPSGGHRLVAMLLMPP